MAGEKIAILRGPVRTIRPTAKADAAAGDVGICGLAAGFWLHDVKKDAVGEFCIGAGLVQLPNDSRVKKAGVLVDVTATGIEFIDAGKANAAVKGAPTPIGVVFADAKRTDDRVLVVWGYR